MATRVSVGTLLLLLAVTALSFGVSGDTQQIASRTARAPDPDAKQMQVTRPIPPVVTTEQMQEARPIPPYVSASEMQAAMPLPPNAEQMQVAVPIPPYVSHVSSIPVPLTVCYGFETIERGLISYFGYYGYPWYNCDFTAAPEVPEALSNVRDTHHGPYYAPLAEPRFESVIRDECVWQQYWVEHTVGMDPPPPVPYVNFDLYAVIAIILGHRGSSCTGVEITHIAGDSHGTTIYMRERIPGSDEICLWVVTNPYHFVKVCKQFVPFEKPTCFEHRHITPPLYSVAEDTVRTP